MHPINGHSIVEDGNYLNGVLYVQCFLHYFMPSHYLRLLYSNVFATVHAMVCYLGSVGWQLYMAELSGGKPGLAGLQCSMVELHRLLIKAQFLYV